MAVDLFCYSSLPLEHVTKVLDSLIAQHPGLFYSKTSAYQSRFIIYEATEATDIQKEIALEYGLVATCEFIISLNDKSASDLVRTVLALVRAALGVENVIIMSDGVLRPVPDSGEQLKNW
ncbi:hypothetical protein [Comamonas odontotermitis]|uniref:hypothetical protein n=1 Tax=Comamonas odontotermitis TaxID=379895 RepID=UPI001CC64024|nr:hypothetical protein [Comamonas odontotermitis]UBB16074.1 hypothetical protein LAD35_14715 [Comamonas odontotermitis]